MKINFKPTVPLVVLSIAVFPLISPLLHHGFPVTDDGEWMIIRFSAFYQELINGQFPVRWLNRLNHGYGYPVATFLYPGFMYIASLLKMIGFGFINSVKLMIIGSVSAAAIFAYLWLGEKFNKPAAMVGALFYVYNPYFVFDIYKRGSVGEILSLAVVACILYAISKKRLILTGGAYGLLIISHNTLALLFLPVLSLYQMKKHTLRATFYSVALGLGLSAFFWLPALDELSFTNFNNTSVNISTFPVWNMLPFGKYVQFPFRLLSLLIVGSAYCSAFLADYLINFRPVRLANKIYWNSLLTIVIMIALFLQSQQFISKIAFKEAPDEYYATNEATTTVQDEYMPVWAEVKPQRRPDHIAELTGSDGQIDVLQNKLGKLTLDIKANEKSTIKVNRIYWPGWRAFIDDKEIPIAYTRNRGMIAVDIPKGKHKVQFTFTETLSRLFADLISFLAAGLFFGGILRGYDLLRK